MTRMRLALLAIGIVVVLAVWIFNKVQERRIQRGVEGRFSRSDNDVLLGDDDGAPRRAEPSFETHVPDPGERQREPSFREPGFAAAGGAGEAAGPAAAAAQIDPVIHAVMTLSTDTPLSGERWMQALHGLRHAGRQTVVIEGDTVLGAMPLAAGERYAQVRVGVQLANRSGALNEIEFSEFVASLQQAAELLGAACDVPDMMETVARARSLDQCCAPLDALVGINVACPDGAWPVQKVADAARAQGLTARSDQRFARYGPEGETLFVLQDADGDVLLGERAKSTTERVTFLLEVPRVAREMHAFDEMKAAALTLAQALGGIVVDDQLHTLTPLALETIGRQIEPVYDRLAAASLDAGSPRALALFR